MQPDWFKQIRQPSDETIQEYLPRHPFKIILPFFNSSVTVLLMGASSQSLRRINESQFFTCGSLYYWHTDCIYPELPKDCFIYTKF